MDEVTRAFITVVLNFILNSATRLWPLS